MDVLQRRREGVSQQRLVRVSQIDALLDESVQQVAGDFLMDRDFVLMTRELRCGRLAGDDGERRDRAGKECLHVVYADEHEHVGLRGVELPAEHGHRVDAGLQLGLVLLRGSGQ